MAYIKYAGEEAVGRIADYVNKKLTFASSMPESPDADTIVLYVGADTSAYKQGGIYQYDGTEWNLINLVKTIELTQAEYDALPSAAKLNGTIYFVTDGSADGSIISGYYNETDGEFYAENTYETQYDHHSNTIYIDLPNNTTYIYDFENEEYIQVGGSGSGTVIKYVSTLPVTGIEDIIYGYNSTTSYNEVTAEGFLDTDDNFIKNENTYIAKNGIIIEASADGINYNTFTSLEYDENNSEFILTYGDSTSEVIAVGGTFYWKVYARLYYAGNASEQNLTLLAGSGGGGGVTYAAGTGIKIEGNIISGDYKADFGINITDDKIKTTDFVGTQAEWNALSAEDKAKYDFIHITDDTSSIVYKPGHTISDGTTEKTQRDSLVFEGFEVTDDSTNEVTKITDIPYTAGDGVEIINHEVSVTEDRPATFVGTTQEWDALTAAEKAQYKIVNLTNDVVGGETVVVDTVESGNLNPVTSNAVYGALALKANLTQISNPNLLDNAWFTVNQRGQSSYSGGGYCVDRWTKNSRATVAVTDDGITITATSNSGNGYVYNYIDDAVAKLIIGKTVTVSVEFEDGTIKTKSGVVTSHFGDETNTNILITDSYQGTDVLLSFIAGNQHYSVLTRTTYPNISYIRAIKLELGSVSTLANDVAPNYQQELAKCQRYFYKTMITIKSDSQTTSKLSVATNTNFLTGVDFPVQMRVQPTYSNVKAQDFFGTVLIDNIVFETSTKDGVCRFYKQNAFTTGTWYYMQFEASADL